MNEDSDKQIMKLLARQNELLESISERQRESTWYLRIIAMIIVVFSALAVISQFAA